MSHLRVLLTSFLARAGRFLRSNPGGIGVLGFQILLVSCAILLIFGAGSLAEGVAVVAYFLLVAGVVVQLVWFWRRGSDSE
jgi:hypothetical protein